MSICLSILVYLDKPRCSSGRAMVTHIATKELYSADNLKQLIDDGLLSLKASHLRTFLLLCEHRTVQEVARSLGKTDTQTSVIKQVRLINDHLREVAGGDLIL